MLKEFLAATIVVGAVACSSSGPSAASGDEQAATAGAGASPQNLFLVSPCTEPCSAPAQPAPSGGRVYRSARPTTRDQVRFARDQLGVTTIISLEELPDHTEPEADDVTAVNADPNRPVIRFMSASLDSMFTTSKDDAKIDEILKTMANGVENGAVMVHCALGRDRTGMIVALHRVLDDHWTPQDAYDEWHAHGFDANPLRKVQFEVLYKYFLRRACDGVQDGCVTRA